MNAGTLLRFALIFLSGLMLFMWLGSDGDVEQGQPITIEPRTIPEPRASYQYCELETDSFRAELSTRGAVLKHFELLARKYKRGGKPHDLSTTPQPGAAPGTPAEEDPNTPGDHEFRQQLFVQFRNLTSSGLPEQPKWGVDYDSVDWKLEASSGDRCEFVYADADVELRKTVTTTERPYELSVTTSIKNLSDELRWHATAIDTVAFWLDEQVEGHMFRVSPYITNVECVYGDDNAVRLRPEDFDPDAFEAPEFQRWGDLGWYEAHGVPEFGAVSNAYFTHALVPLDGDKQPACQMQIEYRRPRNAGEYPPGAYYRTRLAYPARSLEPGASASYEVLSYVGPKERNVLQVAAGGQHHLIELIDLGFFSSIAKVLVSFLLWVYSFVHNWGLAIIILTLVARTVLFPLAIPGIRTMLKMRELKPEMDELNKKYGDDVRAKGVAQMELWRKHGMTPFDQIKGCLPQLATMPVWFALYTTLQTAVELYNIPFLWFPDLSESDPYFILPFVIGGTFFLQQKIAPFQGGDETQRKMMMYFMPGMFTVFMLFLPAGLGIYMFTNSLLAIVQQQVVEAHAKKKMDKGAVEVSVKDEGDDDTKKGGKKRKRNRRRQEA